MTVFLFAYWYESDAPADPVGLVRVWKLAQQLGRLGDRVTVFPPRYRSARGHTGFETVAIPLLPWRLLRPLSYAIGSFLAGVVTAIGSKPAVVYYRWMESPHAILLARLFGSLCVCEVNGEPAPDWSTGQSLRRRVQHALARFALKRCDRVVVLTDGLRELVIRRYEVRSERVIVLPSGADTELFSPRDRVECRQRCGLGPDGEYVGFVGSFFQYQGLDRLLEAMVLVRKKRPSARLLLVGDGEAARSLQSQAGRLGLSSAITWTGRVPYAEVPALIGAMDVCTAPFRADRGETSPVKLFDYLACGRPVVASAITSVSKVLSEEHGVVLVPPDDPTALAASILRLLDHPDLAAELGRRGRQFVEQRYSWASLSEHLRAWLHPDVSPLAHAHSGLL